MTVNLQHAFIRHAAKQVPLTLILRTFQLQAIVVALRSSGLALLGMPFSF